MKISQIYQVEWERFYVFTFYEGPRRLQVESCLTFCADPKPYEVIKSQAKSYRKCGNAMQKRSHTFSSPILL